MQTSARRAMFGAPMRRSSYVPPTDMRSIPLGELLHGVRPVPPGQSARLGLPGLGAEGQGAVVHYAGDLALVRRKCVAVVGSRRATEEGLARAHRLAREIVGAGVVVVSGLAEGIDGAAHRAAITAGGATIAVIGTPLDKVYPAAHAELQERIYRDHLVLSPHAVGDRVFRSSFPMRNRLMAAITDATVIVEASDTSGSLHQAAECARLGRWLFIARSVVENPAHAWPKKFLAGARVRVLDRTEDVLAVLGV